MLCVERTANILGGIGGLIAVIGATIAVAKLISAPREIPGTHDHLDDGKTYEDKEFGLLRRRKLKAKDPARSGWKSDFWGNRLEIWWGECRINVAKTASGVYQGYYTKGLDRMREVRIQKRCE